MPSGIYERKQKLTYKSLSDEEKREYHARKQREYIKRYPRKYYISFEKNKQYYEKHRDKNIEKQKEWRKNNPNYYKKYFEDEEKRKKRNIRSATNNLIIYNKLKKQKNCSLCNSSKNIEKHHPDYTDPLNIIWLCKKCHRKVHRVNQ